MVAIVFRGDRTDSTKQRMAYASPLWYHSDGMGIVLKGFTPEVTQQLQNLPNIKLTGLSERCESGGDDRTGGYRSGGEGGTGLGDGNFESSKNQGYSPSRSELRDWYLAVRAQGNGEELEFRSEFVTMTTAEMGEMRSASQGERMVDRPPLSEHEIETERNKLQLFWVVPSIR